MLSRRTSPPAHAPVNAARPLWRTPVHERGVGV